MAQHGPTYAPSPVRHIVRIDADSLKSTLSNVSAAIDSLVNFEFHPKYQPATQPGFSRAKRSPSSNWVRV
ncbi:hypothetical protein FB451DRAFT_1559403 [Mycena latifolia]|nr:hypothetical protein FB451DRAFT_1559403 [Mycena latifolia]